MTTLTKSKMLKREILTQYKSIRQFAIEMNIPYSTLVTALDRGIEGMAYGTVVRMCDKLHINPVTFKLLEDTSISEQLLENEVLKRYIKLNQKGKDLVLECMGDMAELNKYKSKRGM